MRVMKSQTREQHPHLVLGGKGNKKTVVEGNDGICTAHSAKNYCCIHTTNAMGLCSSPLNVVTTKRLCIRNDCVLPTLDVDSRDEMVQPTFTVLIDGKLFSDALEGGCNPGGSCVILFRVSVYSVLGRYDFYMTWF